MLVKWAHTPFHFSISVYISNFYLLSNVYLLTIISLAPNTVPGTGWACNTPLLNKSTNEPIMLWKAPFPPLYNGWSTNRCFLGLLEKWKPIIQVKWRAYNRCLINIRTLQCCWEDKIRWHGGLAITGPSTEETLSKCPRPSTSLPQPAARAAVWGRGAGRG